MHSILDKKYKKSNKKFPVLWFKQGIEIKIDFLFL